jgi:hypothetical protein
MRKTNKKSMQLLEEDEEDGEDSPFKRQLIDSNII